MTISAVERTLDTLSHLDGVRAAMVVDVEAGVPVSSRIGSGVEEGAMAAMAGSLLKRTTDAARSAGLGGVRLLQIRADAGHLVMAGGETLLVAALTDVDAPIGLIRVQVEQAALEVTS